MSLSFHVGSPGAIPSGYRITAAILLRRIGEGALQDIVASKGEIDDMLSRKDGTSAR